VGTGALVSLAITFQPNRLNELPAAAQSEIRFGTLYFTSSIVGAVSQLLEVKERLA
jgi:hypothetical protein